MTPTAAVTATTPAEAAAPPAPAAAPPAAASQGVADAESETTIKAMLAFTERRDGAALARELERILARGEAAFPLLYEFFRRAEADRPKLILLIADGHLAYGLATVVVRHPDLAASFSAYVLDLTASAKHSYLRRELFQRLPIFLRFHQGRYPALEKSIASALLVQLEAGDHYFYDALQGVQVMGIEVPAAILEEHLMNPTNQSLHSMIIRHIADFRRDDEAVGLLSRVIEKDIQIERPMTRVALQLLPKIDSPLAERLSRRYLQGPTRKIRDTATVAFFTVKRDAADEAIALAFLNHPEVERGPKNQLIAQLRQGNPQILESIQSRPERIADAGLREAVMSAGK
jgi:hypothetical protein